MRYLPSEVDDYVIQRLAEVALLPVSGINVYDIMRSDKLVLTTAAVKAIEARLA